MRAAAGHLRLADARHSDLLPVPECLREVDGRRRGRQVRVRGVAACRGDRIRDAGSGGQLSDPGLDDRTLDVDHHRFARGIGGDRRAGDRSRQRQGSGSEVLRAILDRRQGQPCGRDGEDEGTATGRDHDPVGSSHVRSLRAGGEVGDGEQLRPKPGVRALDAGTSEAGEQATTPTVIGRYRSVIADDAIGPAMHASALRRDHVDQLAGDLDDPHRRTSGQVALDVHRGERHLLDLLRRRVEVTTSRSRSLPSTCTGSSIVSEAASAGSATGQGCWWTLYGCAAALPELLGDVRRDRRQQQQQGVDRIGVRLVAGRDRPRGRG